MKLIRCLLFLFVLCSTAKAQDIIITQFGDTLNRKIIFSTKRYLFFVDSTYYGKYYIKGINKRRIQDSQMNAYRVDRATTALNDKARSVMGNPYMLQGGVQVAYTPFIPDSNATSSEKKFFQDLSVGFSYNISFHYRLRPHSFIGVVIDNSHNSAFAEKLDLINDQNVISHLENITATLGVFYLGPEYMLFRDSKKFTRFFMLSAGIGYTNVKWSIRALNRSPEVFHPEGLGIRISVAKTWAVGKTFIIGPNAKFVNAIAGSRDIGFTMLPRINLGLTVLVH